MQLKSALFVAWLSYVLAGALFCLALPGEYPAISVASQALSASLSAYLIAKHFPAIPPMREMAAWSITGIGLCIAAPLLAPVGSFTNGSAANSAASALGIASLLLPLTCFCLQAITVLAQRFQRKKK